MKLKTLIDRWNREEPLGGLEEALNKRPLAVLRALRKATHAVQCSDLERAIHRSLLREAIWILREQENSILAVDIGRRNCDGRFGITWYGPLGALDLSSKAAERYSWVAYVSGPSLGEFQEQWSGVEKPPWSAHRNNVLHYVEEDDPGVWNRQIPDRVSDVRYGDHEKKKAPDEFPDDPKIWPELCLIPCGGLWQGPAEEIPHKVWLNANT